MFKKLFANLNSSTKEETVVTEEEVATTVDTDEVVEVVENGEDDFSDVESMFGDIDSLMDDVASNIQSEAEKKEKMKIANLLKAYISKLQSVPFHFECKKLARKHNVDVSRIKNASAQRALTSLSEILDLTFDAIYATIDFLLRLVRYLIMNIANFALSVLRKVGEALCAPTPKQA